MENVDIFVFSKPSILLYFRLQVEISLLSCGFIVLFSKHLHDSSNLSHVHVIHVSDLVIISPIVKLLSMCLMVSRANLCLCWS